MTDNRIDNPYPHVRAFGESLGAKLAACSKLPTRGTFWTCSVRDQLRYAGSFQRYRATFTRGIRPSFIGDVAVSAPVKADFEITIYARDNDDAELFAEHYARDYVRPLIACSRVEER